MDVVERWIVLSNRRPMITAGIVAVVVAAFGVISLRFEQRGARPGDDTLAAALIVVASSASLVIKRVRPWWTLALTLAGAVGYTCYSGVFNAAATLPLLVCLGTIASIFPARVAIATTAATCSFLTIVGIVVGPDWLLVERIGLVGWPLVGAIIGGLTKARNRYVTAVQTRAQLATALYEQEMAQRVMAERLRMSRDIHDVVAHHLATLNLQIGTARHLLDKPDTAAQALAGMHANSEAALREIKGLVRLLREEDAGADGPLPGLDDISRLVSWARTNGVDTNSRVRGTPRPTTPDVELAAYRVVQEALTNAVKHAHGSQVRITLVYRPTTLLIEVENPLLTATDSATGGLGLAGMAERVRAAGGQLDVDSAGGTFRVAVELPLEVREPV